jgi:tetratricopeptide (TPR) repeat protein
LGARTGIRSSRGAVRCASLAALAAAVLLPATLRAEAIGVLSVGASPRAERIAGALARVLAGAGWRAIDSPALRARLAGATASASTAARQRIASAERAALQMERQQALEAAREAIAGLERAAARYHTPALLARAHAALALALLLQPVDEEGALAAYRAALEVDPAFSPDPDRLAPRAERLLERARREPARAPASTPVSGELAGLAEHGAVGRLILLRMVGVELEALDCDARAASVRARLRARLAALGANEAAIAAAVAARLGLARVAARRALAPAAARAAVVPSTPPRPRSWYRRWWVWTVIGAAVAGTAVAVGLAARPAERPPSYEVHFSY